MSGQAADTFTSLKWYLLDVEFQWKKQKHSQVSATALEQVNFKLQLPSSGFFRKYMMKTETHHCEDKNEVGFNSIHCEVQGRDLRIT